MQVIVNFFKQSGKWYTSEDIEIPSDELPEHLYRYLPRDRLLDMIVVTEGPTPWGYPAMTSRRQGFPCSPT